MKVMDQVFGNYQALVEKIDSFVHDVVAYYAEAVYCRKGCDSCCRHLTLFPVEAVFIRYVLEESDQDLKSLIRNKAALTLENPDGPCPLLHEGSCLLYNARPIICRTHGYPVLVESDGVNRVDYCPLNFRDGKPLEQRHVIHLEQLNQTLSAVNRVFADQVLGGPESPVRLLMAEALLMDLE